jgi:hypothetical protein
MRSSLYTQSVNIINAEPTLSDIPVQALPKILEHILVPISVNADVPRSPILQVDPAQLLAAGRLHKFNASMTRSTFGTIDEVFGLGVVLGYVPNEEMWVRRCGETMWPAGR